MLTKEDTSSAARDARRKSKLEGITVTIGGSQQLFEENQPTTHKKVKAKDLTVATTLAKALGKIPQDKQSNATSYIKTQWIRGKL